MKNVIFAVVYVLVVSAIAHAQSVEPPTTDGFASGSGEAPHIGSFAFMAVRLTDGSSTGVATFTGPLGRLTVAVDCLRVGVDVAVDDVVVRRRFAIATGEVVEATNRHLLGRKVIFGAIDGDQTTPTAEQDMIDGVFAGDLPSFVTCENSGLAVLNPVVRGEILIH